MFPGVPRQLKHAAQAGIRQRVDVRRRAAAAGVAGAAGSLPAGGAAVHARPACAAAQAEAEAAVARVLQRLGELCFSGTLLFLSLEAMCTPVTATVLKKWRAWEEGDQTGIGRPSRPFGKEPPGTLEFCFMSASQTAPLLAQLQLCCMAPWRPRGWLLWQRRRWRQVAAAALAATGGTVHKCCTDGKRCDLMELHI